ncbi:MAG TPA: carboxypeptidase-like regulatory domain-containing protein, partial [Candidatus Sumerlaeota bacterium]|nr:carboxypeptidase-like regulatory domain-containing protein [Candidatus Sumerlaeota bacterium]
NLFVSRSGYQTFSQIIHINNGALDVDIPMTVYLAKATASLSGAVINTEGKPESGVSVHARQINVFEESQAQSHSAETTDETGKFMFADVADGDYLVTAEKESLSAAEAVTIKEQQSMSVVLTLKKKVKVYGALKTEQSALFQQPLILVNKLTGNSYITQFTKGGQFEFAVPSGVYKIRIGESELSGEVDISDNVESYELDLEF